MAKLLATPTLRTKSWIFARIESFWKWFWKAPAGTKSGDGLTQCISQSKASESTASYKAAIIYNTGAIAQSGNLEDGGATHCYASDIANRLTC